MSRAGCPGLRHGRGLRKTDPAEDRLAIAVELGGRGARIRIVVGGELDRIAPHLDRRCPLTTQLGNSEGPLVGRCSALSFSTNLVPFRSTLALFAEQWLRRPRNGGQRWVLAHAKLQSLLARREWVGHYGILGSEPGYPPALLDIPSHPPSFSGVIMTGARAWASIGVDRRGCRYFPAAHSSKRRFRHCCGIGKRRTRRKYCWLATQAIRSNSPDVPENAGR